MKKKKIISFQIIFIMLIIIFLSNSLTGLNTTNNNQVKEF